MKLVSVLILLSFVSFSGVKAQNSDLTSTENAKSETIYPMYVINFQEKSFETKDVNLLNQIDPNEIESVSVFKNEKAIEKYGEKGKNDVVEVYLKDSDNSKKLFEKFTVEGC